LSVVTLVILLSALPHETGHCGLDDFRGVAGVQHDERPLAWVPAIMVAIGSPARTVVP
jgi:hypothetical protein